MAFCIVPLRSLEVAARLQIPQHSARAYLQQSDAKFFYCITRAAAHSGAHWHARMQFYNGEDPATGSGVRLRYRLSCAPQSASPAGKRIVIEQGIEMASPQPHSLSALRSSNGTVH